VKSIDWPEIAFTIGVFICIILFAGDPDLMDAIIEYVKGANK
jgi:hypothetical protein